MPPVIVVTRGGCGQPWLHSSVGSAGDHPITQFGDPILSTARSLGQTLSLAELSALATAIDDTKTARELAGPLVAESEHARKAAIERLWDALVQHSPPPPTDPREVVDIIVADRRRTRVTGVRVRRTEEMTEADTSATVEPKKPRPIPKDPKYSETSVIKMLADKDGKPYGADNNPKKVGTATHGRFALYADGLTVKEALEKGLTRSDLSYDAEKKFIEIV